MRWIEAASSPCVTATQWTTFGRSARVIMETLISQWIRGQTSVVLFAFAEVRLWVIKFIAGTLFQLITLFLKYIRPQGRTELINHKWARYLVDYYGDEPQAAISHPSFFFLANVRWPRPFVRGKTRLGTLPLSIVASSWKRTSPRSWPLIRFRHWRLSRIRPTSAKQRRPLALTIMTNQILKDETLAWYRFLFGRNTRDNC